MNKLLTLLVLALTLVGFNSNSFAADEGAKAADVTEQVKAKAADATEKAKAKMDKMKKKKKGGEEEEPECE